MYLRESRPVEVAVDRREDNIKMELAE